MFLIRIVGLLCFSMLGLYGLALIRQDQAQSYVRFVASELERTRPITNDQVTRAATLAYRALDNDRCRSNILRPALTVILFDLARTNQAADYDQWQAEHARALAFLSEIKRCMPSDGNIWLREAMVSRAVAESPEALKAKLSFSRQLMPYEEEQVEARLYLWKQMSPFALNVCAELARADIRSVLRYGTPRLKKALREGGSAEYQTLVSAEAAQPPA